MCQKERNKTRTSQSDRSSRASMKGGKGGFGVNPLFLKVKNKKVIIVGKDTRKKVMI